MARRRRWSLGGEGSHWPACIDSHLDCAITDALRRRDQSGFELLLLEAVVEGWGEARVSRLAREALARQSDDIRHWWEADCDDPACRTHRN